MDRLEQLMDVATPEQLKTFLRVTREEVRQLRAINTQLNRAIEEKKQLHLLESDHLAILQKIVFKKGRERLNPPDPDRPRGTSGAELTLHSQSVAPPPKSKVVAALAEEIVEYDATPEELLEEAQIRGFENPGASNWEEIKGLFESSTEITIIERSYKKIIHKRKKYRFLPSVGTDKEVIVAAQGPEKLLTGGSYSVDFALAVVADKYQWHMPLNRQIQKMARVGLRGMEAKTLYHLCLAVAGHLDPVVEAIRLDILTSYLAIHLDESPWQILSTKDTDGYMWVMSNQAGSLYRFEPTRSGKIAEEMVGDYQGPMLCDGFKGYDRFKSRPGVVMAQCWAHARRKFMEIKKNYPTVCPEIIGMMDELFATEHEARTWEELKELRANKSLPLVAKIKSWLLEKQTLHLKRTGFTKAVNYSLKRWDGLTAFLNDVRIPLSNNDAERAIRHAVMGRKNYNGSKTINGADTAAILFTVIESCKRVELEPAVYMKYVIGCNNRGVTALTPLQYAREIRN